MDDVVTIGAPVWPTLQRTVVNKRTMFLLQNRSLFTVDKTDFNHKEIGSYRFDKWERVAATEVTMTKIRRTEPRKLP